jgi:hypothetical protein
MQLKNVIDSTKEFMNNLFNRKEEEEKKNKLTPQDRYLQFKEILNREVPFIKVSESKNIKKQERQIACSITDDQLSKLENAYHMDAEVLQESILKDEFQNTIIKEYLEKMFKIGWETHFNIANRTNKNFNLSLDPDDAKKKTKTKSKGLDEKWKNLSKDIEKKSTIEKPDITATDLISYNGYSKKLYENAQKGILEIPRNQFESTNIKYENISTIQKRLIDNIVSATEELQKHNLPTREKKYRLFCNAHISTALLDSPGFQLSVPDAQPRPNNPYKIGTLFNNSIEIWVDPYMDAKDNRVCISYLDNKLLLAAEDTLDISYIPEKDTQSKKYILSLVYGIEYLGDFSDALVFDVFLGNNSIV